MMLGLTDTDSANSTIVSGDGGRWYAVQCQPNREHIAALNLRNQSFQPFLPFRRKTRRHARKIESVRAPFFPGYLFVWLDVTRHQWRSVNGTFGVVRLLLNGENPAPIPEGFVEALREVGDQGDIVPLRSPLYPGQSVRVLTGPFADYVGVLEHLSTQERVRVLLQIMGGHVPVLLPREDVAPADSML
jgi:transcriptional antiterminator RfaH